MEIAVKTTQSGQFRLDSEPIYAKRYLAPRRITKGHYGADGIPRSFDLHTATGTITCPALQLSRVIDEEELINTMSVNTMNTNASLIHLLGTSHSTFNNFITLFTRCVGGLYILSKKSK